VARRRSMKKTLAPGTQRELSRSERRSSSLSLYMLPRITAWSCGCKYFVTCAAVSSPDMSSTLTTIHTAGAVAFQAPS